MRKQLFYSGPPIQVLHEDYAKRGRIDESAFVKASYEVRIETDVERVWQLLSDARGWERFNPDIRDVQLHTAVTADAPFSWTNGRARIRSKFAVIEPVREITWTGVSWGARAVHRNMLEPTFDGASRIRSEESMAGPLIVMFLNNKKLKAALKKWLTSLKDAAEQRQ